MQKYYPHERTNGGGQLSPTSSDENISSPEMYSRSGSSKSAIMAPNSAPVGFSPISGTPGTSPLAQRYGSGAAKKFSKRGSKRMSGVPLSPVSNYAGNGYNNALEGIAAALRNEESPNGAAHVRRNTVTAEMDPGYGSGSPDSMRTQNRLSLGFRKNSTPGGGKPNGLNAAQNKRKSVILTSIQTSFQSLFKTADKIKEVKGIFSVDTTTSAPPSLVLEEIMRVLDLEKDNSEEFKLKYKQKGYLFKCEYPNQRLVFTLEVCKIRKVELTGVKSKRLKGDLWVYKDYCQRIITKLRL